MAGWLVVGGRFGRDGWYGARYRPMFLRCRCPVLGFDGHRGDYPSPQEDMACVSCLGSVLAHNLLDPGAKFGCVLSAAVATIALIPNCTAH